MSHSLQTEHGFPLKIIHISCSWFGQSCKKGKKQESFKNETKKKLGSSMK